MKTNRWNRKRRSHRTGQAGQATLFILLAMGIFLLGALCFAFDMSNMWFHRQAAQTAADAACAAGAMDILVDAQGGATTHQGFTLGTAYTCTASSTDSVCSYAAKNGYNSNSTRPGNVVSVSFPTNAASGAPPGVPIPPASLVGAFPFIRVDIIDHVQTFFVGLLSGRRTADLRAFSTCGVQPVQSPVPLVILDPRFADTKTLNVGGSATLAIYGGPQQSIQVDSPNLNSAYDQGCIDLSQGGPNIPPTGSDLGTWGGPATQTSTTCTAASGNGFDPGTTGHWLAPNPPLSDPFAQVSAPVQPTTTQTGYETVAKGTGECPNVAISECHRYWPGYYPGGIQVRGAGGTNLALSLFVPGIYYVANGFSADSNSCIRPSTLQGDGSGGVMFYFADTKSINVGSNSGSKCTDSKGVPIVPAFNTTSGTGYLPYGAKCTATSTVPANMPSSLTSAVLLGPCQKPTGPGVPTLCAPNCSLNYGDPQGVSDPLGEQRGFLFFQNRAKNAGTNPNWQGGGVMLLAGTMYFHQCVTSGSDTGVSCSTASAFNDNVTFNGTPGTTTYILGQIIVDQLTLSGNPAIIMDLNSQTSYSILKASIFQ